MVLIIMPYQEVKRSPEIQIGYNVLGGYYELHINGEVVPCRRTTNPFGSSEVLVAHAESIDDANELMRILPRGIGATVIDRP